MENNEEYKKLKENGRDGDDIFIRDNLTFMSQLKIRSKILRVIKDNFDCEELLVIKEKRDEKNEN